MTEAAETSPIEPQHTPGPWRVYERPEGIRLFERPGDYEIQVLAQHPFDPNLPNVGRRGWVVCDISLGQAGHHAMSRADAQLIGATPDLAKALRSCGNVLASLEKAADAVVLPQVVWDYIRASVKEAEAALTKAGLL